MNLLESWEMESDWNMLLLAFDAWTADDEDGTARWTARRDKTTRRKKVFMLFEWWWLLNLQVSDG
jgi:hypothetical protein